MSEPETLNQLSRRTGLPAAWLKREAEAGSLPCLRVGRRFLFSPAAVNRALLERRAEGGTAMPAVAPAYLSPPKIAERLGIDQHKVLAWIRAGELRAVNVGDGARRPRYRVAESDLATFLAGRSAGPEPKISRVRRRRDPN